MKLFKKTVARDLVVSLNCLIISTGIISFLIYYIDILNQLCHPFSRIRAIEKGKVTQLIHYTYIYSSNVFLHQFLLDIEVRTKNIHFYYRTASV